MIIVMIIENELFHILHIKASLVILPDSGSYVWFWCTADQLQLVSFKAFTSLSD